MKKTLLKSAVCISVSTVLALGMVGCKGSKGNSQADIKLTTDGNYPMKTDVELGIWQNYFTPTTTLNSMNDSNFKTYLEEATGVRFKFEHPPVGSQDAFTVMMASDDLPDIIISHWRSPELDGYVDSNTLQDLTPYIQAGAMPNLKKILDSDELIDKQTKLVSGRYIYSPMILGDNILRSYRSYVIRQDLLDKAGLKQPETISEWETVLAKFKEMGIEAPITLQLGRTAMEEAQFTNPFNFQGGFYLENGKVKCGYTDEGVKEWLAAMKKWYDNGWLDHNFVDTSSTRISQLITSGNCGAFYCNVGGGLGTYMNAVKKDSGIEFDAVKIPVKNNGDTPRFNQTQYKVHGVGAVISADCKNKEIAARFLDYGYSEAGQKTWNFGKEGVSYTMAKDENGNEYPKYTDIITDPAKRGEGVSMSQALANYACTGNPVSVQSKYYLLQINNTPQQRKFLEYANTPDFDAYLLPPVMFTADENSAINDKLTPINTYIDESVVKIITGKVDFEEGVSDYYSTLKKLGIDDITAEYQKAYEKTK